MKRRTFLGRIAISAGAAMVVSRVPQVLAEHPNTLAKKWRIGHHFYNWDHAWSQAEFLDRRLELTRETGYEGFEAKPEEIGRPAEALRKKCAALGLECAAIGADPKDGADYAHVAGAGIVRTKVERGQLKRWLDYAQERGVIYVVHPHLAAPNTPDPVETREQLLRYLDERPGLFACPDTGHLALCGSDPVQTIRDLGSRVRYLHLKDIPANRIGKKYEPGEKFCELGTGALDLPGVIKALEAIHYEGWIMIERDSRESDYIKSARNMRTVLKRMGI